MKIDKPYIKIIIYIKKYKVIIQNNIKIHSLTAKGTTSSSIKKPLQPCILGYYVYVENSPTQGGCTDKNQIRVQRLVS